MLRDRFDFVCYKQDIFLCLMQDTHLLVDFPDTREIKKVYKLDWGGQKKIKPQSNIKVRLPQNLPISATLQST